MPLPSVVSMDYAKMWFGAGLVGTLANGLARIAGDYLYTDAGWPMVGAFVDRYFLLPQAGFEIVVTSYVTMYAVAKIPNLKAPS